MDLFVLFNTINVFVEIPCLNQAQVAIMNWKECLSEFLMLNYGEHDFETNVINYQKVQFPII
jgi:hypothetical protein